MFIWCNGMWIELRALSRWFLPAEALYAVCMRFERRLGTPPPWRLKRALSSAKNAGLIEAWSRRYYLALTGVGGASSLPVSTTFFQLPSACFM
jgi:hypothetical protein